MSMFGMEIYNNQSPLIDIDSIISLIQNQMEYIGSNKSVEQIKQAINNAFSPKSRAVLFVGYVKNNAPVAFAFGNVGAGLETGADYFWLNELFVDTAYRRQGYASKILVFIENWLKSLTRATSIELCKVCYPLDVAVRR